MEKVLMYKSWTRNDTRDYIHRIESRLEDIDYYLKRTVEWCEHNGVWENKKVLICSLVTCIWVCSMRNECISFKEIVEIMGLKDFEDLELDKIYSVTPEFQNLDHEEILTLLIDKAKDWGDHLLS